MLWLDIIVHWLHLLAASIWVGGMIFTGAVLAPVTRKELPPPLRGPVFKAVGERFAVVGRIALLTLIATGIYKLAQIWGADDFLGSMVGKAISVKLALVAVMLALSGLHDFVWGPRLAKMAGGSPEHRALLARLVFWSRVNLGIAVAVVFLGAYLRMNPF